MRKRLRIVPGRPLTLLPALQTGRCRRHDAAQASTMISAWIALPTIERSET